MFNSSLKIATSKSYTVPAPKKIATDRCKGLGILIISATKWLGSRVLFPARASSRLCAPHRCAMPDQSSCGARICHAISQHVVVCKTHRRPVQATHSRAFSWHIEKETPDTIAGHRNDGPVLCKPRLCRCIRRWDGSLVIGPRLLYCDRGFGHVCCPVTIFSREASLR